MAEKKDITKLNKAELEEMLQRQEKILQNRSLINSLPDKGKRINEMVLKLKKQLGKREQANDLSLRFQRISLSQKAKKVQQTELDSDDEDDIDAADNSNINMIDNNIMESVASSFDTAQKSQAEEVKDQKAKPDQWAYDSAVTYARKRTFQNTKLITVEESLQIQQQQKEEYEALRAKQAAERLLLYRNPASSHSSLQFTTQEAKSRYRDTVQEDEFQENELQEDEEHGEAGGIQNHEESEED